MSHEEIIKEYEVTEEDIRAALNYAGELIEQEEFHPLQYSGRIRIRKS